ncbi:MAG: efflux RND transporter permease subunit [Gemmatimonadales bacterium]
MIRWAATRPSVMWALAAGLLISGGVAFTKLPLATKTTVELPRLSVGASWGGASPELVEMYLTSPIEAAIQGVRGVRRTESSSREGSASITVELDPNADVAHRAPRDPRADGDAAQRPPVECTELGAGRQLGPRGPERAAAASWSTSSAATPRARCRRSPRTGSCRTSGR